MIFTPPFLNHFNANKLTKGDIMSNITRDEAWEILKEHNNEKFHLKHGLTVEGVMKYFAGKLGYGDEAEFWGIVGLLHDLDFEQFPEEHCIKEQEIRPCSGENGPFRALWRRPLQDCGRQ